MAEKITSKGCEFCNRHGLPVLPVRPSVFAEKDNLPAVPGSIDIPVEAKGRTKYTLRLLRTGFLYIYDEMAKEWINYYMTEDGYYYPLGSSISPFPAILTGKRKPCADQPSELARASLVTLPVLPPPLKNGKFWFTWAETQWTEKVKKQHEEADYRARYMQCFDMNKWLTENKENQVLPINILRDTVAEYSRNAVTSDAKKWATFEWKKVNPLDAGFLIQESNELGNGRGCILTLQDPVGITQEISDLTNYDLIHELTERKDISHQVFTRNAILTIKNLIDESAKDDVADESERNNRIYYGQGNYGYIRSETETNYEVKKEIDNYNIANDSVRNISEITGQEFKEKTTKEKDQDINDIIKGNKRNKADDERLEGRKKEEWAKYSQYINEKEFNKFDKEYKEEVTKYDKSTIIPRGMMYLSWLGSELFISYFIHNFDDDDISDGMDYTLTCSSCITGMQFIPIVLEKLTDWINNSAVNERHVLSRALSLNQTKLIKKIEEATATTLTYKQIPWSTLLDAYQEAMKPHSDQISIILSKYICNISGALNNIIYKALSSDYVFKAVVTLGALNNKAVIKVSLIGTQGHFISHAVRETIRTAGIQNAKAKNWMRPGIEKRLFISRAKGYKLDKEVIKPRIAFLDRDELKKYDDLPVKVRAEKSGSAFMREDEYRNKQYVKWQEKLKSTGSQLGRGSGVLLGTTIAIIQFNNLMVSAKFEDTKLTQDQAEEQIKFLAGIASLFATVLKTATAGANAYNLFLQGRSQLSFIRTSRILRQFGRLIRGGGNVAGFVLSYYDIIHGAEEWDKGNCMLAVSFFVSGGSSLCLIFMSIFPLPVIIFLVVAFIVSTIYIIFNIQDDIQKWLERCLWRTIPDERKP
uniref:T6SS effector BTH_I2691 family protein n=1 Tax=Morganella psychrotolerans TaxID=368603 RepID=UPI0039B0407D